LISQSRGLGDVYKRQVAEDKVTGFEPKLVFVDDKNRIKEERSHIPVQAAHAPLHVDHHGGDSA
jgi:aspartate 1-decarboxylase